MTRKDRLTLDQIRTDLDALAQRIALALGHAPADDTPGPDETGLASGTGDVTREAAAVRDPTIPERVEVALRAEPRTLREIVEITGASRPRCAMALRALRDAGRVYNIADAGEEPRWLWVIGDETTPDVLRAALRSLLVLRPWTFPELLKALGARHGRVAGQLVTLQRHGEPVVNLGDGRKARWLLLTGRDAERLRPRGGG